MRSLPLRAFVRDGSPRQDSRSCGWQPRRMVSAAWTARTLSPWTIVTGASWNLESSARSLSADWGVRTQAMKWVGFWKSWSEGEWVWPFGRPFLLPLEAIPFCNEPFDKPFSVKITSKPKRMAEPRVPGSKLSQPRRHVEHGLREYTTTQDCQGVRGSNIHVISGCHAQYLVKKNAAQSLAIKRASGLFS